MQVHLSRVRRYEDTSADAQSSDNKNDVNDRIMHGKCAVSRVQQTVTAADATITRRAEFWCEKEQEEEKEEATASKKPIEFLIIEWRGGRHWASKVSHLLYLTQAHN